MSNRFHIAYDSPRAKKRIGNLRLVSSEYSRIHVSALTSMWYA